MKNRPRYFIPVLFFVTGGISISAFKPAPHVIHFPYAQANLTPEQAAAHLLNRFSFGSTPGQVSMVARMGLENWFEGQLNFAEADTAVDDLLSQYASLTMSNAQISETYPRPAKLVRMAIREGVISKDSALADKQQTSSILKNYYSDKGIKTQAELLKELLNQKIIRAAYSKNQLKEVLTDFWFNHFNVAVSKGGVAQFVTSYERDAIRPNILGNFEELLLATARSPAMLIYLDNNKSKLQGLNENYAREIMELHTLGVEGGYTQHDVTEAARILTGWGINGREEYTFSFAAYKHDRGQKQILNKVFPAGMGYEEGLQLIHLLATDTATSKFITRKIAVRFVSDDPPQSLLDKLSKTFREKNGNIKEVLITMVSSPEFWNRAAIREKTKSPFELAISAIRNTAANIDRPYQVYQWINRMGQKLYNYQAPTGFPDKGKYWINTGALLNRMNFGLAFAAGRIPGTSINLLALNNNHEPESAEAALTIYSQILMPQRNTDATIKRLTPLINDPSLEKKVAGAADKTHANEENEPAPEQVKSDKNMLTRVAGIILGSPEYQRR